MAVDIKKLLIEKLRETRGAAIVLVALTMVALLSAVALAVDVGMLVTARAESQTLADGAALHGARVLMKSQGDENDARAAAMLAGSNDNTVRGHNVPILAEDVDVIPDEWTVRVRVRRTADRGNAVPTFFARVFGVNEVDVTADAAAWSVESTTVGNEGDVSCPALPLALYNKFIESNDEPGWQEPEEIIGYSAEDHGTVIRLKTQPSASGDQEPSPVSNAIDYCSQQDSSWRCWWRMEDEEPSTGPVADKIRGENCTDPVSAEDDVYNASGNMQSNVHDDFNWLLEQDPDLEWCGDCAGEDGDGQPQGCVVEAPSNDCFTGTSLRLRSVPIIDPHSVVDGGGSGANTHGEVTGFIGVFVERVAAEFAAPGDGPKGQRNVYLRIIHESGSGSGGEDDGEEEQGFIRTLQLIE